MAIFIYPMIRVGLFISLEDKMEKLDLYLSIAEINIKIEFTLNKYKIKRLNQFITAIKLKYQPYITEKPTHINHTIVFHFLNNMPQVFIDKNTETFYIEYFKKVNIHTTQTYYHISILQFTHIVLNIVNQYLSEADGFILHASAVEYQNQSYIFLAQSEGGKSTISKMHHKDIHIIADDYIVIKRKKHTYLAYTLVDADYITLRYRFRKLTQFSFPIHSLFFIHKDTALSIQDLNPNENIETKLLSQLISQPEVRKKVTMNLLTFLENNRSKFFHLHFPKKIRGEKFLVFVKNK